MAGVLICAPRHARAADAKTVVAGAADAPAGSQSGADEKWVGERGVASYYGGAHHGKRTASGARFDQMAMTAAHPWLPLGTKVLVTVERTGRAILVTINDRLPPGKRIIDLSLGAARALGIVRQGLARVVLAEVGTPQMAMASR